MVGPNAALTQTTGGGSNEVVSYAPTSLMVGLSNALAGKADVLHSRGIYIAVQPVRLTTFTTDSDSKTPGVTHELKQHTRTHRNTRRDHDRAGHDTGSTTRREPAAKKAGIAKWVGFHTFRHIYSALLKANNEDVKVVQELMRHANITTTMNIYTKALTPAKWRRKAGWWMCFWTALGM